MKGFSLSSYIAIFIICYVIYVSWKQYYPSYRNEEGSLVSISYQTNFSGGDTVITKVLVPEGDISIYLHREPMEVVWINPDSIISKRVMHPNNYKKFKIDFSYPDGSRPDVSFNLGENFYEASK